MNISELRELLEFAVAYDRKVDGPTDHEKWSRLTELTRPSELLKLLDMIPKTEGCTPEKLFGVGGKPSCPKCYTAVDMTSAAAEGYRDAVEHTVQICKLGNYGSAFDGPEVTRAYTYQHQPHNSVAFRLGQACYLAMENRGGDSIDLGLSLLRQLERVELGVFEVKP